MDIAMTPDEANSLASFLQQTDHYFEFGMGGSTWLASGCVNKSIYSVDSDEKWVEKVGEKVKDCSLEICLHHINIGPTGAWGSPIGGNYRSLFPKYSSSILSSDFSRIDFCLVDGRFRVASFLTSLSVLRNDAIIAIHDYTNRPQYHLIGAFARNIYTVGTLAYFVRRAGINKNDVDSTIKKFQYDPT